MMAVLKDASGSKGIFTDGDWILSENMDANGEYGVIQLKHVGVREFLYKSFNFITREKFRELKCIEVLPGDVLISRMADPIARACIAPKLEFPCVTAVDVTILRVDEDVANLSYVKHLCNSRIIKQQVERVIRGTTRARITRTELGQLEIPLPSLPEQHRIAAILGKADRIGRLRRFALKLSDSYLQSVFLDMFGNPVTNPMGWDTVRIGENLDFMTSGSRGWAKYYAEQGDLFLRVQNLGANRLLLNDVAYVQAPDNAESKRTKVRAGDLLLSATADLGRTGVIPIDFPSAYINQHLFILRLRKELNPYFVAGYYSTESGKAQILRLDREGVKSGLNFDDVKSLRVFRPPLTEQEKFFQVVQRYEYLRFQQHEALRQSEHLFQSLLKSAIESGE